VGHLQLRNVTFAYPTRAVPVFRSFNLSVPAGSTLALVGASGSGKSTVVRATGSP
jgi:ABC-type bacteriocin/lantibiotic exporter with double-glycine peptidase domain